MDMTDPPEGLPPEDMPAQPGSAQPSEPVSEIPAPPQPPANVQMPPPSPPAGMGVQPPRQSDLAPKPKTDVGFFILGFFAPAVIGAGLSAIAGLLQSGILGGIASLLFFPMFAGVLVAFIVGKRSGNVRLWSFGKGGLWAYGVGALVALLAFGTCLVTLNNGGI